MIRLTQKGFGFVETFLLLILAVLVIFVGYYVWHTQQDNKKSTTDTSQTTSTKAKSGTEAADNVDYLLVKELGIKVPLSGDLKDLKYEMGPDGETAGFTTPAFDTAVQNCSDPNAASGSFQPLASVNKVAGMYDADNPPFNAYSTFIKQFPDFYLLYGHADGGLCSGSDASKNKVANDLFDKLSPELKQAIENSLAQSFAHTNKS
jgi:Na+-transporting methylmalonyl-CoA/oxaloacetate decarboxylase gamma subunit